MIMNHIEIPKVEKVPFDFTSAIELFDKNGIDYVPVDNVNWASDYPYKPEFAFRMAHTGDNVIIEYKVRENSVASVAGKDNGRVWEDSCCELFTQLSGEDVYYNMECNCTGRLLIGCGPVREGRTLAPVEVLERVKRWSSLGTDDFELKSGDVSWQMVLVIPKEAWFKSSIQTLNGLSLKANIYKCGDKLAQPHFLSWNKIDIKSPDFHRPDFFGNVVMK